MSEAFGVCPTNLSGNESRITLAHGEGGRLTRSLVKGRICPLLGIPAEGDLPDAATLPSTAGRLAFTTDSYVVSPLFFPGGDIGKLAVYGTTNDLAVSGAIPRWLSFSLIIEEGLAWDVLEKVLRSVAAAAAEAGVTVVAGDTKVVPRGAADGLFINTSGIGLHPGPEPPGPSAIVPGDELLVSGDIARHGIAVLAARESMGIDPPPTSDCGSLIPAVEAIRREGLRPRAMRDATRGGVGAVLHEWAAASGTTLCVDESALPVADEVSAVCELLGLDPLHVANEGTMLIAVPAGSGDAVSAALRRSGAAPSARRVGQAMERRIAPVLVRRGLGRDVPLDEPLGAPLPRIC